MKRELFMGDRIELYPGDSRDVLRALPANSIDSIVTDPPYALVSIAKRFTTVSDLDVAVANKTPHRRTSGGFMGKKWDTGETAFSVEFWAECLRVLKPGGHVVAFSGTRTYHRMACAIEDAGFEVRDMLQWLYGSGFPKSHDVSKGIDKARRRDFVQAAIDLGVTLPGRSLDDWTKEDHSPGDKWWSEFTAALPKETWIAIERRVIGQATSGETAWFANGVGAVTAPATDAAREWQGWGTALKPACEPICFGRKPLIGTVATNVLEHGTGAINIDGCRVGTESTLRASNAGTNGDGWGMGKSEHINGSDSGRWPANVIHDGSEEVVEAFPEAPGQQGDLNETGRARPTKHAYGDMALPLAHAARGDSGSAARFFYTSKADADDRLGSKHPTVKPVDLIQWLVRLVTPKGGTVLDPFAGTGTTGEACFREGMRCILIERESEYQEDIRRRMALVLAGPEERARESIKAKLKDKPQDAGPLFSTTTV